MLAGSKQPDLSNERNELLLRRRRGKSLHRSSLETTGIVPTSFLMGRRVDQQIHEVRTNLRSLQTSDVLEEPFSIEVSVETLRI